MNAFRQSLVLPIGMLLAAAFANLAPAVEEPANAQESQEPTRQHTIVDVARKTDNLTTFCELVELAGLTSDLSGKGPFTVFAPSNEAFAKLGTTLAELKQPEKKAELARILKHHVLAARHNSRQLASKENVKCLLNEQIKVEVKDEKILVGGAEVVEANIRADNGVIHVINAVLIPAPPAQDQPEETLEGSLN